MLKAGKKRIFYKIGLARSKFIETFNFFTTYIVDKIISKQCDHKIQQNYLEMYYEMMNGTLEYEIFICDYNFKHNISENIETMENFSQIDKTRTEYITTSLNNLERHDFLKEKFSIENTFNNFLPKVKKIEENLYLDEACCSKTQPNDDIGDKIQSISSIFPHLGDGFIKKCLEIYDFKTDHVIQAILEDNLPPHILEIPLDYPIIPPEPEPEKPILAYRGKKPGYEDTLSLLNDKKEKAEIKTLVLDGIKYTNRYTYSDDDDFDEEQGYSKDYVIEHDVDKYEKPNEDDLVSDTSHSDTEFDDDGKPVPETTFKPFCENPEIVRARYQARIDGRKGKSNVVGKPKGQGQEKSVINARQKKNVNKSSRANHNRKGGAQFKRNKGMVPS